MSLKSSLMAAAVVAVAAGLSGQPALSQPSGVKAGILTCNVDSGWSLVIGSTRDLKCVYSSNTGRTEHYGGHVDKYGVDIGYKAAGVIVWGVLASTENLGNGALAGTYVGGTAGATLGVGGTVNLLVGGSNNTITLQPLSVEGMTGINVAAAIEGIVLKAVE